MFFSFQIVKIYLLMPIAFCLGINLLEKGYSRGSSAVFLCSHLLQAKSTRIFSSVVQAAEARLAHLSWCRMVGGCSSKLLSLHVAGGVQK